MKQHLYPIPSREDILGILRTSKTTLKATSIAKKLGVKAEEIDGMAKRLKAMERDGQIEQDLTGKFSVVAQENAIVGRVSSHRDGYGFLSPDDGSPDLYLHEREMTRLLNGDRISARVVGTDRKGRLEGAVLEVLERANTHIIGRLIHENGVWLIAPEDNRMNQDILLAGSPG
ncbi:MAG: ribonuclease R, partial [Burkholderiales bacterium]|nr:ribonuclease R [Burkholderiales bacterium]